jgi:hypothetical protein
MSERELRGVLSPGQQQQAVQAARDIHWHRTQLERWEPLYQKAVQAGDVTEATGIASIIEMHNSALEEAQRTLGSSGL